jgi:hypothetical protein
MADKKERSESPSGVPPRVAHTADELSREVKRLAASQPIKVELTQEQFDALMRGWRSADPTKPAQITFVVGERPVGEFSVAAYSYHGDTCCV